MEVFLLVRCGVVVLFVEEEDVGVEDSDDCVRDVDFDAGVDEEGGGQRLRRSKDRPFLECECHRPCLQCGLAMYLIEVQT